MVSVMRVPLYKCRYCDYSSKASASVMVHERRHTGEKPFSCRYCPYTAARKGQVTVHERTHTDERPYACPDCTMRFKVSSALLVHRRTHTGERPYKCVNAYLCSAVVSVPCPCCWRCWVFVVLMMIA